MIKVSFNVDEPFWAKEMPLFKKSILKATKETLNTACEVKQNNLEVNFLLTSDSNIRSLNKNYRNKDKSTNVLAFPMNHKEKSNNYLIGEQFWGSEGIISIVFCSYIFYAGYIVLMPSIYLLNKQNWSPIFRGTGATINVLLNMLLIQYFNIFIR